MAGLEFEKPILELEKKINELRGLVTDKKIDWSSEIKKLEDMMRYEAEVLNFEKAATLRDKIREIKKSV